MYRMFSIGRTVYRPPLPLILARSASTSTKSILMALLKQTNFFPDDAEACVRGGIELEPNDRQSIFEHAMQHNNVTYLEIISRQLNKENPTLDLIHYWLAHMGFDGTNTMEKKIISSIINAEKYYVVEFLMESGFDSTVIDELDQSVGPRN